MNAPITYNYYINNVCNKLNINEKPELTADFPNEEQLENIFKAEYNYPDKFVIEHVLKETYKHYNRCSVYYKRETQRFVETKEYITLQYNNQTCEICYEDFMSSRFRICPQCLIEATEFRGNNIDLIDDDGTVIKEYQISLIKFYYEKEVSEEVMKNIFQHKFYSQYDRIKPYVTELKNKYVFNEQVIIHEIFESCFIINRRKIDKINERNPIMKKFVKLIYNKTYEAIMDKFETFIKKSLDDPSYFIGSGREELSKIDESINNMNYEYTPIVYINVLDNLATKYNYVYNNQDFNRDDLVKDINRASEIINAMTLAVNVGRCECQQGLISIEDYRCTACKKQYCNKCRKALLANHICKEQDLKEIEDNKDFVKYCPSCGTAISRTKGCNDMYCTVCTKMFNWETMKIITANHENPERTEALIKKGMKQDDRFEYKVIDIIDAYGKLASRFDEDEDPDIIVVIDGIFRALSKLTNIKLTLSGKQLLTEFDISTFYREMLFNKLDDEGFGKINLDLINSSDYDWFSLLRTNILIYFMLVTPGNTKEEQFENLSKNIDFNEFLSRSKFTAELDISVADMNYEELSHSYFDAEFDVDFPVTQLLYNIFNVQLDEKTLLFKNNMIQEMLPELYKTQQELINENNEEIIVKKLRETYKFMVNTTEKYLDEPYAYLKLGFNHDSEDEDDISWFSDEE